MAHKILELLPETNIYDDLCRLVADIIVTEEAGQRSLMPSQPSDPLWRTFCHRANPIIHWDKDDFKYCDGVEPVVNVTFDTANSKPGSSSNVNTISKQFQLFVDCYALGIGSDVLRADEMSGRDALNLAGKIEGIIHSGPYAYLDRRGLIQSRSIVTSEAFQPTINDRAVQRVRCVRHTLIAVAAYDTYQQAGELFNAGIVTVLDNDTGEVRFKIEVDLT
jgi:hypothetical protein